VLIKQAKKKSA